MMKGFGKMGKMMQAAQQFQEGMKEIQETVQRTEINGSAGAGDASIEFIAKGGQVLKVNIGPGLLPEGMSESQIQTLQALIAAAANDTQEKQTQLQKDLMTKLSQELGLPDDIAGGLM